MHNSIPPYFIDIYNILFCITDSVHKHFICSNITIVDFPRYPVKLNNPFTYKTAHILAGTFRGGGGGITPNTDFV